MGWTLGVLVMLGGCQCLQPTVECPGGCGSFDEWCLKESPAYRCANLKACGMAADLPCEAVLPWPVFSYQRDSCPVLLREAVDAGQVVFDETAAARCLDSLATQCRYVHPDCDRVLVGTRAAGETCRTRFDCQPGRWCDLATACPGTCRAKQPVDAVVPDPEQCATASYAELADGGYRCQEYALEGQACGPQDLCADGLSCAQDGGCAPAPAGGRRSSLATRGQRCTGLFQGIPLTLCQRGLACHVAPGATEGTCGALYAVGESCFADATGCGNNSTCRDRACVALGPAGAVCTAAQDCIDGLGCHDGHCGPKSGDGATCGSSFDCEARLRCVAGVCTLPACVP